MGIYENRVRGIVADTAKTPEEKIQEIDDLRVPGPGQGTADRLWQYLVGGLLIILIVALIGILWAVLDGNTKTSPDVAVTVFTATLTGLLGLFVSSPST